MNIDLAFHHWLQAHRDPSVVQLMLWISQWHDTVGLLTMALVVIVLIRSVGETPWDAIVFLSVPGAMLLNVGLKHWIQRARPPMGDPIVVYETFSFPSGHAASTSAFYAATLAWLLWRSRPESRRLRIAFAAIAVFMVLCVAWSRLVLGVHYLSDVIVGIGVGVAWTLLCIAAVKRFGAWRQGRK